MSWRGEASLVAVAVFLAGGCGGSGEPAGDERSEAVPAPAPSEPAEPSKLGEGPHPALLVSQAHFVLEGGAPIPQPGKVVILRTDGKTWEEEVILDEGSNVVHKALPWRGGLLTIGGTRARVVHWTRGPAGGWTPQILLERSWGGGFDRFRDVEIGDADGDGDDEIVLATHDQGVVVVGDEVDGTWTFTEMDQTPDTFVHEIEIGDVDGDGRPEFYATPSDRNLASLVSQPGSVVRYDWDAESKSWKRSAVADWEESHAKEILVTDLGTGHDHLYAVREGHTEKTGGAVKVVDPVRIVRLEPTADGSWSQTLVATLEDQQCRVLVAGDVDGDGTVELIAAGMRSGVWLLEPATDGSFTKTLIDANSSGFEHATHV
ncbi:MAG: VCBS repeat-containing protein, partial [Deltaproteobacteria bacterium]|nr:VCBS repeat-containing protein [Deltaproteobacteria bacterium]